MDDADLAEMRAEAARQAERRDGLVARIQAALTLYGPDEQPPLRLTDRGLWSAEWRFWDRSRRRWSYPLSIKDIVSKDQYDLLCQYGTLPQLELAWAAMVAHPPCYPERNGSRVSQMDLDTIKPPRRRRPPPPLERSLHRVKEAMVEILVKHPNADLTGHGAIKDVARQAGVAPGTLSGWFAGTGLTARRALIQVFDEAAAEAARRREKSGHR